MLLLRGLSATACVAIALGSLPASANPPCWGESASAISRAVRLACSAHNRAARTGGMPDLSRLAVVRLGEPCRESTAGVCRDVATLCYGDAFDATAGAFPAPVSDLCARRIGTLCTRALSREVRSPGRGLPLLARLARLCGDPLSGDLGGACDGVDGNEGARTCLAVELGSLASAVDPSPEVSPAECGFPGSGVVKPVVPGAEFDLELSPWRRALSQTESYEPASANLTQMSHVTPSAPDHVNLSVREWTFPVYNVVSDAEADCPPSLRSRCFDRVASADVYLTQAWNPTGHGLRHVPVPSGVALRPDPQGDSHLAIVDWVHGIEYDFWGCLKNADGTWRQVTWPSTRGGDGATHFACQAGGKLWLRGTGTNVIGPDSAKGSGFALTAGLIRPEELVGSATVAHALAIAIGAPASGGPVPPANLSDGTGPPYPEAPPEGARLRLRPELWSDAAIDASPWNGVEKRIARALRDWGAVVCDDSGGSYVDFYAEAALVDPGLYDAVPDIGPGGATGIFDASLFTAANFQILAEPPQRGPNDDGSRDLDGDGMFDSFEIAMGWSDRYEPGSAPNAADDPDGDGLTNLEEQRCLHATAPEYLLSWSGFAANPRFQYPCNPHDADTDHDSFPDPSELAARTDPTDPCSHP